MQEQNATDATDETAAADAAGAAAPAVEDGAKETKAADDTAAKDAGEEKSATAGDDEKTKAEPTPFELKIDLPEGLEIDEARLGGFKETITDFEAKLAEAGGDRDAIRAVVSTMAGTLVQNEAASVEAAIKAHTETVDGWKAAVRSDPEIGGAKYDESMSTIALARDRFGSEALQEVLDETGMGNHPELARFFLKVGRKISESDPTGGAAASAPEETPDKILFG